MDLATGTPAIAALVNSKAAMRRRWGDRWESVAHRLFQLSACPAPNSVAGLAGAHIVKKRGEYVFEFPDGVQVRARCSRTGEGNWAAVLVDVDWEPRP